VEHWPLLMYLAGALVVVGAMLAVSWVLGQRHRGRVTGEPYESGMPPTGTAQLRFPAHFYLVAMFFLLFDLETVFVMAWAIAWDEVGWVGYAEVVVFLALLLTALVFLWRRGALEWGTGHSNRQ